MLRSVSCGRYTCTKSGEDVTQTLDLLVIGRVLSYQWLLYVPRRPAHEKPTLRLVPPKIILVIRKQINKPVITNIESVLPVVLYGLETGYELAMALRFELASRCNVA